MAGRSYDEILPAGYIIVNGVRYLLLHPEPLATRDAWANGLLYFSVAKAGEHVDWVNLPNGETVFTYSRITLVVHPQNVVMEMGYIGKPVLVWTGEYEIGATILAEPTELLQSLLEGLNEEDE